MTASTSRYNRRHGSASNAAIRKVDRLLLRIDEAQRAGRLPKALSLCEAALQLAPEHVDLLCNCGWLAVRLGLPEIGADMGRRATALRPDFSAAHHCLGVALRHQRQTGAAISSLARAVELDPGRLDFLLELGHAYLDAGDLGAAAPVLGKAFEIDASSPKALTALGRLHLESGRPDDAVETYRRAIALGGDQWATENHLGNILRDAGDLAGSISAFRRAIELAPDRPELWSDLLLTLQCSDASSAREIAEQHRAFGLHFKRLLQPLPPRPRATGSPSRLKIGYLSSHFRRHAVAKFFEPLIASHDTKNFDIHCYYNHAIVDDLTHRIREHAGHFSTVYGMRDGFVAAQIRRDGIDILVDLDGHTVPNRLPVFFLRAAPIQVTWLGYLSTTGVDAIDYRLTDARADPPALTEALHAETLWRLPDTAWCYQPYPEAPVAGPSPLAANGYVTFVCLNNPGKVTLSVLEMWARILQAVPTSRLNLHVGSMQSRIAEMRAFFETRGIAASRVALVQRQSIEGYFALYDGSDIALDTWPCAGGTTTCDALWMGVPVVTLMGDRSYSRTGGSLLANVGLDDCVAETPDEYVAKATALARDPARLQALRGELRKRMESSCLTDGPAFARAMESAFVGMWERHGARGGDSRK